MALRVTQSHVAVLGDEPAGFDGTGVLRVTQSHAAVLADDPGGFDGLGEFRATQMHVSVMAAPEAGFDGSGEMRVTQMHVSVLAGFPPEPAEDTIALTETISTAVGYNRSVSDTVAMSESGSVVIAIDDTIALTETIELRIGRNPEDTIALYEAVTTRMGWNRSVSDTIDIQESLLRVLVSEDTIALNEQIVQVVLVEDTIGLTETLFNSDRIDVFDSITLSDTTGQPVEVSDTIALTEIVEKIRSGQRESEDGFALYEAASYILNADCPTCCGVEESYKPQIGSSSNPNAPTPPSTTAPTLTPSNSIVLSHPLGSPTLTVTLRAPVFGNRDRLTNQRITRESRGGTLQVFADPQWPRVHTLVMDFAVLSEDAAQDYLDFVAATLGKEIRLVDHESRNWRGVLVQPDDPITRNKRCDVSASLIFEGELV